MGESVKRIVLLGNRLFMKFPSLAYFQRRADEIPATVVSTDGMDEAETRQAVRGASALVLIGHPVPRDLINEAQELEFIMTLSVGFDVVDVAAATERKIPVSNCPLYCSEEVAQHAITLALTVGRKIHELIPHVRDGGWDYKQARPVHSLTNRRFAILGLGRIGRQSARIARGLGMRVLAYDPYLDDDIFRHLEVERCYELADLLSQADYLTVHTPLTDETWHLLDRDSLALLPAHAVVVNTARGGIIDREALEEALSSGAIGGAGVDVLESEPPTGHERLLSLPNAVVTPHIAWYSEESHEHNMTLGMDELVRVLTGYRPRYVVNPQIFSRR